MLTFNSIFELNSCDSTSAISSIVPIDFITKMICIPSHDLKLGIENFTTLIH